MVEVRQTLRFRDWINGLRDVRAKARIALRIERAANGNLGDWKTFGGVTELRVDYGPGYRLYAARRGEALIILLCGGDKSSQKADIKAAKAMLEELED